MDEEKIKEWKELLDKGEIDEESYKREVAFITMQENKKKSKIEKSHKHENKHKSTKNKENNTSKIDLISQQNQEKIKEWKELLDKGEIDKATYKREIAFINMQDNKRKNFTEEQENRRAEYAKKHADTYVNRRKKEVAINGYKDLFWAILTVILIAGLLIFGINMFFSQPEKIVEQVPNLYSLESPKQKEVLGCKNYKISGHDVRLVYQASYSISGRVLTKFKYYPFTMDNKIRKFDMGISWGKLATESNRNKMICVSPGDRGLHYKMPTNDMERLGGFEYVKTHISHNHLIPFSRKIEKLLDEVKIDDFVRLDGYLVNVYDLTVSDKSTVMSSLSRGDSKDGACETMLVTDVVWLEDDLKRDN